MLGVIILSVLLALCSADDPAPHDSYIPLPLNLVADPLLRQLQWAIYNAEAKESSQIEQLKVLVKEADDNVDFKNDFENNLYTKFQYHQHQQDARLDALAGRVAEINALRSKVQGLEDDANSINDNVNDDIYPYRNKAMYTIQDLQNEDIDRIARIQETEERAEAVNDRIDYLFAKSWDNFRALIVLDNARRDGTTAVNRQQFINGNLTLTPGDDPIQIEKPFEGRPQYSANLIVGFHSEKTPSAYYSGFDSLYFGVTAQSNYNSATVDSFDMSSGEWGVDKIFVSGTCFFLDNKARGLELKPLGLQLEALRNEGRHWPGGAGGQG